jgi:hypothetical protein
MELGWKALKLLLNVYKKAVRKKVKGQTCPASDAMCKAVLPFLVAASILAPRDKSSFTTLTWPSLAAR